MRRGCHRSGGCRILRSSRRAHKRTRIRDQTLVTVVLYLRLSLTRFGSLHTSHIVLQGRTVSPKYLPNMAWRQSVPSQ